MTVNVSLYRSEAQDVGGEDPTVLGPFRFVHITYDFIRCGEDGPEFVLGEDGFWHTTKLIDSNNGKYSVRLADDKPGWSDITISEAS